MVIPQKPVKKQINVAEGLFTIPINVDQKPSLIGSQCLICKEVVFPAKTHCPACCSKQIEQVYINPRGKLYSFTVVYQAGPIGYKGPVPYGVVKVEMSEGLRISGYCTENNVAKLKPGMDMELIIDKLFDDENGNEIIGYKFKPVDQDFKLDIN
jgi:uncharacterized protein